VTVVEMVVAMFILSIILVTDLAVFRQLTTLTSRLQSTGDAMAASRAATDTLSRSMPFASQVNNPTKVGTTWYLETLTTAVAAGASPQCTQWRVDSTADLLQVRTWTQGSSSATTWRTVARWVANDPTSAPPFAVRDADSTYTLPRISVSLTFKTPRGAAAVGRGSYTLRNAEAGAVGTDVVCTEVARS
jgi:type II secretory pathway pseudopilin PulG